MEQPQIGGLSDEVSLGGADENRPQGTLWLLLLLHNLRNLHAVSWNLNTGLSPTRRIASTSEAVDKMQTGVYRQLSLIVRANFAIGPVLPAPGPVHRQVQVIP